MAGLPGEQEYTAIGKSAFEYDNPLIAGGILHTQNLQMYQNLSTKGFIKNPWPRDIETIAAVTSFAASTIL